MGAPQILELQVHEGRPWDEYAVEDEQETAIAVKFVQRCAQAEAEGEIEEEGETRSSRRGRWD
jgi:hypothetical protein